jgi:hypothetical protein
MGFVEDYLDGDHLDLMLEHGTDDRDYHEAHKHLDDYPDPDWDTVIELGRFKKLHWGEYTLYVFYDEEGDPVCAINQYV